MAEIIADLETKAGFVVPPATTPLLNGFTIFSPTFPARVRRALP